MAKTPEEITDEIVDALGFITKDGKKDGAKIVVPFIRAERVRAEKLAEALTKLVEITSEGHCLPANPVTMNRARENARAALAEWEKGNA